jgi:DNA-directed RNA polymerase subunit K/omega
MKALVDSRSSQVDLEKCVGLAGSRYDMIVAVSQRLRELKRRARETGAYVTPVDALLEMQEGKIDMLQYMSKVK